MTQFETHVHTTVGSYDGATSVEEVVEWVRSSGIGGVCITEHDYVWPKRDIIRLQERASCVVVQGVEVSTDLGHVLAFGLSEYVAGIHQIEVLKREISRVRGALVLAHPFRTELSPYYQYGSRPSGLPDLEEVLARPVFRYVDALEACNGSGTPAEEDAVRRVASALGIPVTGGSDAHRATALGLCATEFTCPMQSERDFVDAILNGACTAVDLRSHGKGGR